MDAIVKVYVTEHNDIIKHYSNVTTIWQMSANQVTALLINLNSEMKGVQEKESFMGVKGKKNPSLTITV